MVNEFVGVLPASYPRIFFFGEGGGGGGRGWWRGGTKIVDTS